ncbi:hypothetical protein A6A04_07070 [Paramagnetospirillum marisnigri]|uniref:Uncharacterized protein n=1 Tax=Paramagnetospirillum marisnigri TaxID=1285242 RepID=A0A178MBW8_9PROT|nr:hypothetical protein [Paramagnetospirillum marisnigri]OAN45647.1 hypothetical protein A6A04_07070 [Paramagnetospirillum marisnigri]
MIRVATLDQARAALTEAPPGAAVLLFSPPAAALSLGVGWWRALERALRHDYPDRNFEAVLDCGPAPGHALEAIRAGVTAVMLDAPPNVLEAVADIATASGARVLGVGPALPLPSGERK